MADRLKMMARNHNISLNKFIYELSSQTLAAEDVKQRFLAAQLSGDPKKALQLLDELDAKGL